MNKKMRLFFMTFIFILIISLLTSSRFNMGKFNQQTSNCPFNYTDLKNLRIVSHRAKYSTDDPENSITGLKDSIKHKVDYAEIDVQETKDGVVILMHDKNLKRLAGVNNTVDNLNYSQIKKLRIKPPDILTHRPEKIPTLEQAMIESRGRINLIIDIKPYGNTNDLTNSVVALMNKYNLTDRSLVQSMSYNILWRVKRLNPKISTGYIVVFPMKHLPQIAVDFYSIEDKFVTRRLIKQVHKDNKKIYVWTIDDLPSMSKFCSYNPNGIITDNPKLLLNTKESYFNQKQMATNE